jgi:hypothetical protein
MGNLQSYFRPEYESELEYAELVFEQAIERSGCEAFAVTGDVWSAKSWRKRYFHGSARGLILTSYWHGYHGLEIEIECFEKQWLEADRELFFWAWVLPSYRSEKLLNFGETGSEEAIETIKGGVARAFAWLLGVEPEEII